MDRCFLIIATLVFTGYLPVAPGTFGAGLAFLLSFLLLPSDSSVVIALSVVLVCGIIAAHKTEKLLGKDSRHIVIDEFCGYLVSILFIPKSFGTLTAAFILFRLFDIVKPPPLRQIERHIPGGAGIMLDDVLAGIYTNLSLQVWMYFW